MITALHLDKVMKSHHILFASSLPLTLVYNADMQSWLHAPTSVSASRTFPLLEKNMLLASCLL